MKRKTRMSGFALSLPLPWLAGRVSYFLLSALAMSLLLFSAARPDALSGARVMAADVVAPVLGVISAPFQQVSAFVGNVTGVGALRAENERLLAENTRLREWYQTALMLQAQNQSLQDLLNIRLDPQLRFVSARVVAETGSTFVKSLLVTAGQRDGVARGQAVLSGDGLVGRIIETGDRSARILLLTDFSSRVPVTIEGSRQQAILAGDNSNMPRLIHLPQNSDIATGSQVVTSGSGGLFAPGLPVGVVEHGADGEKRVRLFAATDRLVYVRVLSQPDDPRLRQAPASQF